MRFERMTILFHSKKRNNMPVGVVKSKRDEKLWNRAKARTRAQYPYISEDSDRFFKITMTIFKSMSGKS